MEELEAYFATANLPDTLDMNFYKITNVKKMIDSHLALLKANPGNARYLPFWNRLRDVHDIITTTKWQ